MDKRQVSLSGHQIWQACLEYISNHDLVPNGRYNTSVRWSLDINGPAAVATFHYAGDVPEGTPTTAGFPLYYPTGSAPDPAAAQAPSESLPPEASGVSCQDPQQTEPPAVRAVEGSCPATDEEST